MSAWNRDPFEDENNRMPIGITLMMIVVVVIIGVVFVMEVMT